MRRTSAAALPQELGGFTLYGVGGVPTLEKRHEIVLEAAHCFTVVQRLVLDRYVAFGDKIRIETVVFEPQVTHQNRAQPAQAPQCRLGIER